MHGPLEPAKSKGDIEFAAIIIAPQVAEDAGRWLEQAGIERHKHVRCLEFLNERQGGSWICVSEQVGKFPGTRVSGDAASRGRMGGAAVLPCELRDDGGHHDVMQNVGGLAWTGDGGEPAVGSRVVPVKKIEFGKQAWGSLRTAAQAFHEVVWSFDEMVRQAAKVFTLGDEPHVPVGKGAGGNDWCAENLDICMTTIPIDGLHNPV